MTPLEYAKNEIGVKEKSGSNHNSRIIEYHSHTSLGALTDETPWCAAFVCWCLEKAGIKSTNSARARSYLTWGVETKDPQEGDIVVLKRSNDPSSGHVTFFIRCVNDKILCLGGNQSDSVCYAYYKKEDVLSYRRV